MNPGTIHNSLILSIEEKEARRKNDCRLPNPELVEGQIFDVYLIDE
jgi:hypothetical protein